MSVVASLLLVSVCCTDSCIASAMLPISCFFYCIIGLKAWIEIQTAKNQILVAWLVCTILTDIYWSDQGLVPDRRGWYILYRPTDMYPY